MEETNSFPTSILFSIPLPPPWVVLSDGSFFNEATDEITQIHPAEKYLQLISDSKDSRESEFSETTPTIPIISEVISPTKPLSSTNFSTFPKPHTEYRCTWREIGPSGQNMYFGLTIRYNLSTTTATLKFDGVDAKWQLSAIEGVYGPIDFYDLFIGGKVKIFGRYLTITAASPETVQLIDSEGNRLLRKQEWLRNKIESVGAVPIIKKSQFVQTTRSGKSNGTVNLRKLVIDNSKLGEQIANLGMAHLLIDS